MGFPQSDMRLIPELELPINSGNGIGIDKLELKFATKKLNPQINLPFNFLIHKYFLHDNPIEYKLLGVGIPGR